MSASANPDRPMGALGAWLGCALRGGLVAWTAFNLAVAVVLWFNPSFMTLGQVLGLGIGIAVLAGLGGSVVLAPLASFLGGARAWEALWGVVAGGVLGLLAAIVWITTSVGGALAVAVVGALVVGAVAWVANAGGGRSVSTLLKAEFGLGLLLALVAVLRPPLMPDGFDPDRPPILIAGVDGATWNVLDPLVEEGVLPNFEQLMDEGVHGTLTTLDPLFSPVIWTTVATGKLPEKHGITVDRLGQEWVRNRRIWQMLGDDGYTHMVFGYLLTAPPKATDTTEVIVPGWIDGSLETFPESYRFITEMTASQRMGHKVSPLMLARHAANAAFNGVRFSTFLDAANVLAGGRVDRRLAWANERFLKQKMYGDIFRHLYAKHSPDFAIFYNNLNDALQHKFWHYYFPDEFAGMDVEQAELDMFGPLIREGYLDTDRILGELMEMVPENGTFLVMSDHGFKSRGRLAGAAEVGKFYRVRVESFLGLTGLDDQLMGVNLLGGVTTFAKLPEATVSENEILEAVRVPRLASTGQPVLQAAINAEGYVEVGVAQLPPGTPETADVQVGDRTLQLGNLILEEQRASGWHSYEGVLMGRGPRLRANTRFEDPVSIVDIVPMLLHLTDNPTAEDLDGQIPRGLFTAEYANGERAPIATYDTEVWQPPAGAEGITDEQRDTLRSLGYIN